MDLSLLRKTISVYCLIMKIKSALGHFHFHFSLGENVQSLVKNDPILLKGGNDNFLR